MRTGNHRCSSDLEKNEAEPELSVDNVLPGFISTEEIPLAEERKSNIMVFKDENTQTGNPVVTWTQNGGKRNYNNERFINPKYKGRGRGRRDVTGSLEYLKDNGEHIGSSCDTRGQRWNFSDGRGLQARDSTVYNERSRDNSPEMARMGYDRHPGYSDETSRQEPRSESGFTSRGKFGSSVPIGCFICGGKDHRSAYCKNNAAMFD